MSSGNKSSSSASLKGCCCCLLLLFSFLALLSVAVILVIVLAIKPKKPEFTLQNVNVQYINFTPTPTPTPTDPTTNSPIPNAYLSLIIHILFNAKNDNIGGIKYRDSTFTIMYRGVPLGRGIVPGFYQDAHSKRNVQTTVSVDRVNVMQPDMSSDLVKDVFVNDRVDLRIMGDVNANIRIIGITSPGVQVSIDCAIVISPSKQALISKQCGFDGLQV